MQPGQDPAQPGIPDRRVVNRRADQRGGQERHRQVQLTLPEAALAGSRATVMDDSGRKDGDGLAARQATAAIEGVADSARVHDEDRPRVMAVPADTSQPVMRAWNTSAIPATGGTQAST